MNGKHMVDTATTSIEEIVEVLKDLGHRNVGVPTRVDRAGNLIRGSVQIYCVGILLNKTVSELQSAFAGRAVKITPFQNNEFITIQPIL